MAVESEMVSPKEQFVSVNGLRFHFLEWGDAGKPPLLLVHGGHSSARGTWLLTAPAFAERFHIIAPDLRGHGETDWDPEASYFTSTYADDIAAVVKALGIGPFWLVGHSMGGGVSITYASRHPDMVRGLVLVDSGVRFGPPEQRSPREHRPLSFASRAEAEGYARSLMPETARGRPIGYGFRDLPDGRTTWRTDVAGLARARATPRDTAPEGLTEALGSLEMPILVLRAGKGAISAERVARMEALNQHLRVVTYPDANHWLHQDEPDRFESDLNKLFSE
jgi:esterase